LYCWGYLYNAVGVCLYCGSKNCGDSVRETWGAFPTESNNDRCHSGHQRELSSISLASGKNTLRNSNFLIRMRIIISGYFLIRLNTQKCELLGQRSKRFVTMFLECLFDISPGFVEYSRGYRFWMCPWLLLAKSIGLLVKQKAKESERSNLEVPTQVVEFFTSMYQLLGEQVAFNKETRLVSNNDFRNFLRTER